MQSVDKKLNFFIKKFLNDRTCRFGGVVLGGEKLKNETGFTNKFVDNGINEGIFFNLG